MRGACMQAVLMVVGSVLAGCNDTGGGAGNPVTMQNPRIYATVMPVSAIPPVMNEQSTYWYTVGGDVNAESLLGILLTAGVPVTQAWLPLDNWCMDVIGARFTVELAREHPRMLQMGFAQGSGRLSCATMVKHYIIR